MQPQVAVSCFGKLHAFDLADQLQKRGMLHSFFTSYAYQKNTFWRRWVSRVDTEDLPLEKIHTIIPLAIGRKVLDYPDFWNELFDRWVAAKLLKNQDFDVFIGWSGMCSHSIALAKKLGKKTIVTRGSSHILTQKQILQEEYARYGIQLNIGQRTIDKELVEYETADFIGVPSEFAYQSFLEQGVPAEKLFLNNLAVELSFGGNTPRQVPAARPFRVLYLGHMSPRKGIQYLFEAFKAFEKDGLEIELWVVGGDTSEMKTFSEQYQLPGNIKLFGHVPRTEIPQYIQQCHVGILPSLEEGLAKVIPEMLIQGLPVIATFNSGGSDIIQDGENGFIIPIRSVEAIIDRIRYFYDHFDALSDMGNKAIESIQKAHNWNYYGERYQTFLESIITLPHLINGKEKG